MAVNPYSDSRKRANQKWDAANIERFSVALPKGYKDALRKRASETGETVNGLLRRLIEAELKQA